MRLDPNVGSSPTSRTMKDYFSKEDTKALKKYGIKVISKLKEIKLPFKPRGKKNHIKKKIKCG